jgi:small subunit ribosomal protein S20
MPHSKQAKKRVRQNEKSRIRNKSRKSEIKTLMKKVEKACAERNAETAKKLLAKVVSKLDKAEKTGIYHKNTVARKKSKLSRLVASLG